MPRRRSSRSKRGVSPGQIIGISVAVLSFFVAAFLVFRIVTGGGSGGGKISGRNASSLNVYQYLDNANSLRGNVYKIDGTVSELLRATDNGRLVSFSISGEGGAAPVPILFPPELRQTNIERGSSFSLVVTVERGGMLVANDVN